MQRLRDAGNTLVVVEHDPKVMQAADRVLDIGPGPGEHGGEIVFFGAPPELAERQGLAHRRLSVSGAGASIRRRAGAPRSRTPRARCASRAPPSTISRTSMSRFRSSGWCASPGVSGSGKSTLVHDVLYPALLRAKGKPTENPGRHRALQRRRADRRRRHGRSEPHRPHHPLESGELRRRLRRRSAICSRGCRRRASASTPPGTFSFNAGNGRCPTCGGNGFEHVEMQFLSDVYLRCPDCDGRRYRAEVLECKLPRGAAPPTRASPMCSISRSPKRWRSLPRDSRGLPAACSRWPMSVSTTCGWASPCRRCPAAKRSGSSSPAIWPRTRCARIRQGGARPTAGSAAARCSCSMSRPPACISTTSRSCCARSGACIDAGHSLLVIEHNLDVRARRRLDHRSGSRGRRCGRQGGVRRHAARDHARRRARTPAVPCSRPRIRCSVGRAVQDAAASAYRAAAGAAAARAASRSAAPASTISRTSTSNLGRNQFTVITGVSGSGKSTLAFDILFAEGQRRYLESLNAYARQFVQPASRPDVDAIFGIPPDGGHRAAHQPRRPQEHGGHAHRDLSLSAAAVREAGRAVLPRLRRAHRAAIRGRHRRARCSRTIAAKASRCSRRSSWRARVCTPRSPSGRAARDFAQLRVDGALLPTAKWPRLDRFIEHNIELPVATLTVSAAREAELRDALESALEHGRGVVHVARLRRSRGGAPRVFSTKRACPTCGTGFPELDPRLFSFNSRHGWCKSCFGTGLHCRNSMPNRAARRPSGARLEEAADGEPCARLRRRAPQSGRAARAVPRTGRSRRSPTCRCRIRRRAAQAQARGPRDATSRAISWPSCGARTAFLCDVGLGYLQLNRAAPTLSGGEAQRIRLAAQLGSNLQGVCYVLDEPTIGLHPRDNVALLDTLDRLRGQGQYAGRGRA